MTHTLRPSELRFLGIIEDVDDLQKSIITDFGEPLPAMKRLSFLDDKWWSVEHFSRAGGYWAREKPFAEPGSISSKDLGTFDAMREAALKASPRQTRSSGAGA